MGSTQSYVQTEHQSGASRLLNSIFMAVCVAPLIVLGMCIMLGWNERRAVCADKAISSGRDAVQNVGCNDPMQGSGSLVMFSCNIDTSNLQSLTFNGGDFQFTLTDGIGYKIDSYMYQCIESTEKRTVKDKVGGGETTYTYYSYKKDWSSSQVDSSQFGKKSPQAQDAFRSGCNSQQNLPWPQNTPKSTSAYQSKMKVGAFTTTMTHNVPLNFPLNLKAPIGWSGVSSSGQYTYQRDNTRSYYDIGDTKVSITRNDPSALGTTVLGENTQGTISPWVAPSSWLCSGFTLSELRMGTIAKGDLFTQMASENNQVTWILRFVGFALMWVAFCLCFGPLEVAGDCIPCVGPWIGDSIAAISCCVACLPATACTLGVAGIVWVAMRPLVGIPCMIVFLGIMGGMGYYIAKKRADKRQVGISAPFNPTGFQVAEPTQPQPPRQMQVQAPLGSFPGQPIQFQTPDGRMMSTTVPGGVQPGGYFTVTY